MRILFPTARTPEVFTSVDPSSENMPATGRVKPNRTVATAVMIAPPIMNGRRLPNFDFELSASTPELHDLSTRVVEQRGSDYTNEGLNDETG